MLWGERAIPLSVFTALCNIFILCPSNVAQGPMTSQTAPPTLPEYIANGLPKQADQTLRDAREFIGELLAAREQRRKQPISEDELPADAEVVEEEQAAQSTLSIVPVATRRVHV